MAETVLAVAGKAAGVLAERGIENARLNAELLLAHVLGAQRLDLYLQHDRPLTDEELAAYRVVVRRRLRHEPLQYILGGTPFREIVLRVDARALVPRPETEVLVGHVIERARGGPAGPALDLGTGTGAIALSLVAEGAFDRVVATDVSAAALALAAENAARLGLGDAVELRQGDVWEAVRAGERFAAIVSNPPYVAETERALLPPEVRDWEPVGALFAGEHGLAVIERIIAGAAARLLPGGLLALEVGATQGARVTALLEAAGYDDVRIEKDLTGRERVALAQRGD